MELTKSEIKSIKKYHEDFDVADIQKARGCELSCIIMVSHGLKELHDSGYPWIKAIGVYYTPRGTKDVFYDLGWHDHWVSYYPCNTDSLGKNVFRVMPWSTKKKWRVSDRFLSCSSLMIGDYLDDTVEEIIIS